MATITYEHVTKRFDDTVAVDDLNIDITDGEFLVLVGPSGCGKTTALRMLAGLEDVTEGRILIGDRVVNNVAPGKRNLAMVFQSYALYPHMTVYGNLAFSLKNFNVPKAEIDRRVREAADILELGEAAQAQAEAALGRAAAAGRARPRDRARAGGVPHGRAALEPRRGAPRADARRDPQAPDAPRDDHDLRDARPGRGDDDGRPDRGDERGRPPADRDAGGGLHEAREHLRRDVHRLAVDERPALGCARRGHRRQRAPRRVPARGHRARERAAGSRQRRIRRDRRGDPVPRRRATRLPRARETRRSSPSSRSRNSSTSGPRARSLFPSASSTSSTPRAAPRSEPPPEREPFGASS